MSRKIIDKTVRCERCGEIVTQYGDDMNVDWLTVEVFHRRICFECHYEEQDEYSEWEEEWEV